ncbi:MAG: sigma 54-interacting transcriptional regulator [bacterium]
MLHATDKPSAVERVRSPHAERVQALLEVAESVSLHRDLEQLFHDLAPILRRVVPFQYAGLILHDSDRNATGLHVLESPRSLSRHPNLDLPVEETPEGWVWQNQQPLLIPRIGAESRFPRLMQTLRDQDIRSLCAVPLTTAQRRLGALSFGRSGEPAFNESDLDFLHKAVRQASVAVDNALNSQRARTYQQELSRERDRLRLLLDVNNAVVSTLDLRELFTAIGAKLRRVMRADMTSLGLYEPAENQIRLHALDFPDSRGLFHEGVVCCAMGDSPVSEALRSRQPVLHGTADFEKMPTELGRILLEEGMKSACCVPLISHSRLLGTLSIASRREAAFGQEAASLLAQVAGQISIAVENALAYRQVTELNNRLAEEKLYLEEEIQTQYDFEEIVGDSTALKRVLKQVEIVAPTDSTVLIQGETGTGKELIARAIRHLSRRRDRTLVKVNCAAIPTGLLESELFGHEKGAFTGAITQKIGRFELAHQGTLFLDEVGDISPELQAKLLRVLQEKEFERLGSTRTIRVAVRLVAATNRDLFKGVAEGQFRSDLYYRLNVFPIVVPPLRERREDIPLLVRYFAQKYSRLMNKRIETIPAEAMAALTNYPWPGNVRELENFVERAVILSAGSRLLVPLAELKPAREAAANRVATLEEAEREHILRALQQANGVIGGPSGAAALLGMKRTTLQSRMKRFGISRRV